MKKISAFLTASTVLLSLHSFASNKFSINNCNFDGPNVQVYSRGQIDFETSDFNGITVAGLDVKFKNFHIGHSNYSSNHDKVSCPSLVTAGNAYLYSGNFEGVITAGKTFVAAANTHGAPLERRSIVHGIHQKLNKFSFDQSTYFSALPITSSPKVSGGRMIIDANYSQNKIFAVRITAQQLQEAQVIELRGNPESIIVVTITGTTPEIINKNISLDENLSPGQVLFNFPQATTLEISKSGSQKHNIPVSVLAPYAAAHLTSAAITGQVFVGSLCGNIQVDAALFRGWKKNESLDLPPPLSCKKDNSHCN